MRTIIAGSRHINDLDEVKKAIQQSGMIPSIVLSGTAGGVDTLGEEWATLNWIPVERYPADWETYGKSAGYKRNAQMVQHADALIAIWDGTSKGTQHMIDIAKRLGLKVHVHIVTKTTRRTLFSCVKDKK